MLNWRRCSSDFVFILYMPLMMMIPWEAGRGSYFSFYIYIAMFHEWRSGSIWFGSWIGRAVEKGGGRGLVGVVKRMNDMFRMKVAVTILYFFVVYHP
jgi:hypothetical protein